MKNKNKLLLLILLLGLCLRLFNLNWDNSNHLHPDERFMTMVASSVSLNSLNPADHGYEFYVYGSFPLLVTRIFAQTFHLTSYDTIFLLGRVLSAVFDVGTIYIIYLLSGNIFASLFYALAVFPIQQSHFFTVDSFTVFFSTLTIWLFLKKNYIASGTMFGLTLACKTSIVVATPLFIYFLFVNKKCFYNLLNFFFFTFLSFRIFQPFAFIGLFHLDPVFINNIKTASQMISGAVDYPPNLQWVHTLPFIHPFINIFFFGLGPILTLLTIFGLIKAKHKYKSFFVLFIFAIFCYQGIQWAKYMRYFYPIYPFLCIFAGLYFAQIKNKKIIFFVSILPTIFFLSIYLRPNTRVSASDWIEKNIAYDKVLSMESWDDPLPLNNNIYKIVTLNMYGENFNKQLSLVDYLILSSPRAYKSVSKSPQRFPLATKFYQQLFAGQLNYRLIKTFSSFPVINDSFAEESFSVYDHPTVYIFRKIDTIKQWIF